MRPQQAVCVAGNRQALEYENAHEGVCERMKGC